MKAALMWTISDFPGYAMLSGWSTKGRTACPSCHKHTHSRWLYNGHKFCYLGHRRFLPSRHVFRRYKSSFDNQQEFRSTPKPLSGTDVLNESTNDPLPYGWKKHSIFFTLPYWKDNILRHNLAVMHIEKNVCDNIIGTLLNVSGKSKDTVKSRLDMKLWGIRDKLHPRKHASGKLYMPKACFTLLPKEKRIFCKVLKSVKVPDGYAANISRCVNLKQCSLSYLKSHDCHILMQQLLPLAIRRVLPKSVSKHLIQLCSFFRELCSKVGCVAELNRLQAQIALTLCELERIFPPSFFDVMVHLTIHLVSEAKLGGPVQQRWMYPIERYLSTLKSYVGNKAHPEGSIANGHLAEECLAFCSSYLQGVETRLNRPSRNEDNVNHGNESVGKESSSIFPQLGRPIGEGKQQVLDDDLLAKAHQYLLSNCADVDPFVEQHLAFLKAQNPRATPHAIQLLHNSNFRAWFAGQVNGDEPLNVTNEKLEELRHLARSPINVVRKFDGFIINGYRFHTKDLEERRKTQNSGVMVTAGTQSFASTRDKNPIYSDITYYGVIQEIIELDYWVGKKVVLFKCDWVSGGRGLKQDDLGFTLVNFSRRMRDNEPFILASQTQQVFYVADPIDSEWQVVIRTQPRDLCEMPEVEQDGDVDAYLQSETCNMTEVEQENPSDDDNVDWIRTDVQGDLVDDPGEVSAPNTGQIPDTEIEDDGGEEMETNAYNY